MTARAPELVRMERPTARLGRHTQHDVGGPAAHSLGVTTYVFVVCMFVLAFAFVFV